MTLNGSNRTIQQEEISVPVKVTSEGLGTEGIETASVWYRDGILYVDTPSSEQIAVYSMDGQLLYRVQKTEGKAEFDLNSLPGGVLVVRGESGREQKIVK
jgi:hypothetical protein